IAAVRVDRLAEQRHFLATARDQSADLIDDGARGVAAFTTARRRDHAEGAVLLASLHHGHEGLQASCSAGPCGDLDELARTCLDDGPTPFLDPGQQLAHPGDRRRSEHEIDVRRALLNLPLLELRHAPHHADDETRTRALQMLERSQLRKYLVLRLLADGARVEQD